MIQFVYISMFFRIIEIFCSNSDSRVSWNGVGGVEWSCRVSQKPPR